MKNFIHHIFQLLFRAALLLAGLVFFASLMVVAMLLLGLWLINAMWAKLTGRPAKPWVFRMDPRAQWSRFNPRPAARQADGGRAVPPRAGDVADAANAADVTDVIAREIEDTSKTTQADRRP